MGLGHRSGRRGRPWMRTEVEKALLAAVRRSSFCSVA
jgi:hypothetical protein